MDINTTYGAPGVTTSTTGMGVPSGGDNMDFLRELVRRRFAMDEQAKPRPGGFSLGRSAAPSQGAYVSGGDGRGGSRINPVAGPSWQSLQGAATRPTGLGAQMIPGMAVDQSLLPPSMRHQSASFQGGMGPSMAGLSPDQSPPQGPTSNSGFDYLSPVDRARAMAAAQRR